MKFSVAALVAAASLIFLIALELGFGISWSMRAFNLPDADLKPWRPGARLIFTGIITSMTIFFTAAWIRISGRPE